MGAVTANLDLTGVVFIYSLVLPRDKGSATQCRMLKREEVCGPELLPKVSGELVSSLCFEDILFRLQTAHFWFLGLRFTPDL